MGWTTTEYMDEKIVLDAKQAGGGAVAGILNGAKCGCYTNAASVSKTSTLADLTLPTGALATPTAVTWAAANRDTAGNIGTDSQLLSFVLGALDPAIVVKGLYVVDTAGTGLLAIIPFTGPGYPLNDVLDALDVVIRWIANNPTNAGDFTIVT